MKICKKCGSLFEGRHCRICANAYAIANPEKHKVRCAKYRTAHRESRNAITAKWCAENPERKKISDAKWQITNRDKRNVQRRIWNAKNPAKVSVQTNRRRAAKLQATPAWANGFFIEEIYDLAHRRTKATGFKWHVDHAVPLKSKLVCGLHVEHNLQVIPAVHNIAKSNLHWMDMP